MRNGCVSETGNSDNPNKSVQLVFPIRSCATIGISQTCIVRTRSQSILCFQCCRCYFHMEIILRCERILKRKQFRWSAIDMNRLSFVGFDGKWCICSTRCGMDAFFFLLQNSRPHTPPDTQKCNHLNSNGKVFAFRLNRPLVCLFSVWMCVWALCWWICVYLYNTHSALLKQFFFFVSIYLAESARKCTMCRTTTATHSNSNTHECTRAHNLNLQEQKRLQLKNWIERDDEDECNAPKTTIEHYSEINDEIKATGKKRRRENGTRECSTAATCHVDGQKTKMGVEGKW